MNYFQYWGKCRHYFEREEDLKECPVCGKEWHTKNLVDENGTDVIGFIEPRCCGYDYNCDEPLYHLPDEEFVTEEEVLNA